MAVCIGCRLLSDAKTPSYIKHNKDRNIRTCACKKKEHVDAYEKKERFDEGELAFYLCHYRVGGLR